MCRLAAIMIGVSAMGIQAQEQVREGEWMTMPRQFREQDTLTVRNLPDGKVNVAINTVFCPTNNMCMNARLGGIEIEGIIKGAKLRHSEPGCKAVISFSRDAAVVTVTGCKDNFPYGGPKHHFRWVKRAE